MPLSPMKEEHVTLHSNDCRCSACLEYWEDARECKNYGEISPVILEFPLKLGE